MMRAVFLAFSAFIISFGCLARDYVTASCPSEFPTKTESNKSLPLAAMETWSNGIGLIMPSPFHGKDVDFVFDDMINEIRCLYDRQDKGAYNTVIIRHNGQHQITIEVPKKSLYCTGVNIGRDKTRVFCMGPKKAVPATPPPMFVSQPVDYGTQFQGFGLRQTEAQILEEAHRQGFEVTSERDPQPNGRHRLKLTVAAPQRITVWLSPETGQSVEVRQDFERSADIPVLGGHLYGSFDLGEPGDVIWSRNTGVIIVGRDYSGATTDNYLRLIDDAEISKETGQPLGYKKYIATKPW